MSNKKENSWTIVKEYKKQISIDACLSRILHHYLTQTVLNTLPSKDVSIDSKKHNMDSKKEGDTL